MPRNAKTYIALVIASGAMVLLAAAGTWSSTNLQPFFLYLGLAVLTSGMKVRIPGLELTVTPNFVFLLLGIVALPFSQVVMLGLAAALVQSLWGATHRPRLVQVVFSAAALMLSCAAAYGFSHFVLAASRLDSAVTCVILAGSVYFPLNSALVSIVVGLVEGEPLKQVCQRCYEWVFPYFMGGIAFAAIASGAYVPSAVWKGALSLVPAAFLAHLYFLNRAARPAPVRFSTSSHEEEEYLEEVHR